ncbi:MAG TPA: DinB family protein [Chitinophagaceae bacterium]|nr:DinB family protein [Chitinophagaceae bacterium]
MQLASSIATRLQYQHKTLLDLIDGLTDEQIRRTVFPGKWSIFENIVHLQTYQHVFCHRARQILQGSMPRFDRYTADVDPLFLDNCHRTSREIMQDLLSTRKMMSSEFAQLNEKDFGKQGVHPYFGTMNLLQWLNFFLLHEAHHMFTIFKLSAELQQPARQPE